MDMSAAYVQAAKQSLPFARSYNANWRVSYCEMRVAIFVQCRCGQAFSALPALSGCQVPCPLCGQTLLVPAANVSSDRSVPPRATQHVPEKPFVPRPAIREEQSLQQVLRKQPQLWVLLTICIGGSLASLVIVIFISVLSNKADTLANHRTRRDSKNTGSIQSTASQQIPFNQPSYGEMVALPSNDYEIWFPETPKENDLVIPFTSIGMRGFSTATGKFPGFQIYKCSAGNLLSFRETLESANEVAERQCRKRSTGQVLRTSFAMNGLSLVERSTPIELKGTTGRLKMIVADDGRNIFLFIILYEPGSRAERDAELFMQSFHAK